MPPRSWLPILGAAMTVVAAALPFTRHPPTPALVAGALAAALSGLAYLLWRSASRAAAPVLYAVCLAGFTVVYALSGDAAIGFFAAASFAVLQPPERRQLVLLAVATVVLNVVQVVTGSETLLTLLATDAGIVFFAAIGWLLVSERRQRERADRLLVERDEARQREAEAAIHAERVRMARELHDLLAHTLSGLAIQLEAARVLGADAPAALRERIDAAQRLARAGLREAREAVGALRGESIPAASVDALVEEHRLVSPGGVRLTVTGEERALPADVALTVHRVVQESLSNVRTHAPAVCVEIALHWSPDRLVVTVANPAPQPLEGPGWGITGMRERAASVGATLDAGWDAGVFTVRLDVPLA